MASLKIQNITKTFPNGAQVLKGINLDIANGEFVILVGGSGCGKSTLLNIIAGLEVASGGDIVIDGAQVNELPPKDRDIAMVFQSYALYPSMSVRENIAFGLSLRKMPQAQQDETINRVAHMLQMTHLLDRKPAQLSGGQRQRVAMGRALARQPKLFLFDEPLSNLDAKLRVDMRREIKLLHKQLGTTMVYVTHDQIEAMTLADKIAVMHEGRVQQYASPKEIYEAPANLFVAGFMGSPPMNLLKATLRQSGGAYLAEIENHAIKLAKPNAAWAAYIDKPVILGLRPEHLSQAGAGEADLSLPLLVAEPTGADTHLTAQLGSQTLQCRFDSGELSAAQVDIKIDSSKACLFDPASEQRIA